MMMRAPATRPTYQAVGCLKVVIQVGAEGVLWFEFAVRHGPWRMWTSWPCLLMLDVVHLSRKRECKPGCIRWMVAWRYTDLI